VTHSLPRAAGFAATVVAVLTTAVVSVGAMVGPPPSDPAPRAAVVDLTGAFYAGCGDQAVSEPSSVPIWCASTDQRLENLVWSTWGGRDALATGVLTDNPCDCAGGRVTAYPVAVRFDHPEDVGEARRYLRLHVTFPAARPAWASRQVIGFRWGHLGFVSDQEYP